ncbi:hypothetical protein [Peribacillus frigoritolerans]|uniref:Phage protein n=1 Tax=Peribacillus castrilensis TaxID=2897690 RepID=A0AAW9N695_9BACI|nr:hypothetical protein [Peribacillus castrilensis]
MNLEKSIEGVISEVLTNGTIEDLVKQELEKGAKNALDRLFGPYGDVTKVIEKEVKSVMVPYLENYDYSHYITKLDSVLVDVLKATASENTKILTNFKELMTVNEEKAIKVTDLFEVWKKYVAENVETDDLDIDYDDMPSYQYVDVKFEFEEDEGRSWSSFKHANIFFECEHDEKMNFAIKVSRFNESSSVGWDIDYPKTHDINSLKYLNDVEILLMKLNQNNTRLIIDSTYENDEVQPEAEPEATFG